MNEQIFFCNLQKNYEVRDDGDGISHTGKGISSFASLSNEKEVNEGLLQLQADLRTGKFDDIKKQYNDELSDYVFIVAENPADL